MTPSLWFQTVKGGISETRIEKRIVITGDADIDHDQVGMLRRPWAWEGSWAGRLMDAKDTSASFTSKEPPQLLSLLHKKKDRGNQITEAVGGGRRLGKQGGVIGRNGLQTPNS